MAVGDKYRALHQRSLDDPEGFWAEQAKAIDWTGRWDKVLDASNPPFYRWFAGAALNTAPVEHGSSVAVMGLGGVGLAALMAAKVRGAAQLIAVDPVASRRDAAIALGATHASVRG